MALPQPNEQGSLVNETIHAIGEEISNLQSGNLHKRASWTVGIQSIKNSASLGRDFAASARSGGSLYVTFANQLNGKLQAQPWNMLWQEGVSDWSQYPLSIDGSNNQVDGGVASVVRSTDRMESFFGRGNEIYSYYFVAQNGIGNWFSSSEKKARAAAAGTSISAVSREPRSMEIFYVGNNGDLRHSYSNDDGQKWVIDQTLWSGPVNPISLTSITSTRLAQLAVFWTRPDGAIWGAWLNGSGWQGKQLLGPGSAHPSSRLTTTTRSELRINIFYIGNDKKVHQIYWKSETPGTWNTPSEPISNLAATPGSLSAVSMNFNHQEVFFLGSDSKLKHAYWTEAAKTWKSEALPGANSACQASGSLGVVSRRDGTMEGWCKATSNKDLVHFYYYA
ncbi:hypothetical protein ONS96_002998 [Cadophora gregata f. sp. sojae]|nr:hypothetical protein ONS96_002998 [Cadophora gregata f. sp. sojae]